MWRNPGVDMSDFFNYGLDEKQWKDYYKLMASIILFLCNQGTWERCIMHIMVCFLFTVVLFSSKHKSKWEDLDQVQ